MKMVRLILRRDRVLMPIWVLFIGLVPLSYVSAINGLFPTAPQRQSYADLSAHNAGFVALYGRLHGSSLGELVAWRGGFIPIVIAIVAVLTVIRHTRTEEEAGRRELLGSTVVGRHAGLAAAVLTTAVACLLLGVVLAVGLTGQDLPASGAWALGMSMAMAGWIGVGIAAVAAQLTTGAGGARGIAMGVIAAAFVVRMVGDIASLGSNGLSWLTWVSPLGWLEAIRPFGANQWWPVLVLVGLTVLLTALAAALSARRDVGSGLLPARLGPASAGPALRSPFGLAWRLHRGLLAGWTIGFAVLGIVMGYLASSVGDLVNDSKEMAQVFARLGGAQGLIDNYLASVTSLFGLVASAYGIQAALRMRGEEAGGRLEPVLATAAGRTRWAASHLVFALLGPAVVLLASGLTMGLAHGLNVHDVGGQLPGVLAGAVVQLPAVWVLASIAVLFFGVLPRASMAAWVALVLCMVLSLVGPAVRLDQWLLDLSPFTHVPHLPGGAANALPVVVLVVIAAVLAAGGLAGWRRRDVTA
ncbi:ABC-2 type transport system permease protein [Labedaea rhizosphaerae]|uniref:ABC-2 type transport system permease protein n=2 Tax=Labedaea rhizosphaerae TaxID=598644 RepID=A0A4R6S674_LABRH|nr:ABC-2 type transport system permease protein [Labedaea rhizosphaerae]